MKRFISSVILCVMALALRIGVRAHPQFADFYAGHINAFWVNTLGRLSSVFGSSLVEILIYLLIILAAVLLARMTVGNIRLLKRMYNLKKNSARSAESEDGDSHTKFTTPYGKDELLLILFLASLIFFLFECNEDMYFDRTTFSNTYGYGQGSYSTEELEEVCRMLVKKANALSGEVTRNGDGIMQCDEDIRERTRFAMTKLGEEYSYLGGWFPKAKPVLVSQLLSYSNFTGIYSAYTIEANYNTDMTPYNIPFTICHELSHLKGVMQENQANFCAYLACVGSEDADILYSGYLSAWVYCGNELYRRDRDKWKKISGTVAQECNEDLKHNNEFWARYEGKVSEVTENFNDSWLKYHGQSDGTLSYDKVVDLIISYETGKK